MDPISIVTDILVAIFSDVAADQINDILHDLLSDPQFAVMSGNGPDVVALLAKGLLELGLDPSTLSDHDWYDVAQALSGAAKAA